jgi:hypothetical protein
MTVFRVVTPDHCGCPVAQPILYRIGVTPAHRAALDLYENELGGQGWRGKISSDKVARHAWIPHPICLPDKKAVLDSSVA